MMTFRCPFEMERPKPGSLQPRSLLVTIVQYDRISILKSSSFQLHLAYSSHFRMSQIDTTALSPSTPAPMSYAEKQAYCRNVLKLPGPVDRWLTSNRRSPWIAFQHDYMLLPDIQSSHVVCFIASVAKKVSN